MKEAESKPESRNGRSLAGLLGVILFFALAYFIATRSFLDEGETPAARPASSGVSLDVETAAPTAEFPNAELRDALGDFCSERSSDAADATWLQDELQTETDAFNKEIDAFIKKQSALSDELSVSSSPEHLHVAAMLADDPATRVSLLEAAIANQPNDSFLLWDAVRICSETKETVRCPLEEWERLMVAVDGQNSEAWIRVAANRYAAHDYDAALDAMRYASSAAESRVYWTEMVEMIERGFAAGSDLDFSDRAFAALMIASLQLPRYRDYLRMCEDRSVHSTDWASACLAYGERVESQGKTEMGVSISRDIQRIALEELGELELAAKIRLRQERLREEKLAAIFEHRSPTTELLVSSPTLFSAYLAAIRSEGETSAWRQLTLEVERIIEQQPELACEPMTVR